MWMCVWDVCVGFRDVCECVCLWYMGFEVCVGGMCVCENCRWEALELQKGQGASVVTQSLLDTLSLSHSSLFPTSSR